MKPVYQWSINEEMETDQNNNKKSLLTDTKITNSIKQTGILVYKNRCAV
jgi:hypothetical protein